MKNTIFDRHDTLHKMVILSGGIDSNTILLDAVRDKVNGEFKGNIYALYIDTEHVLEGKRIKEKDVIDNIIKKIKEDFKIDIHLIKYSDKTEISIGYPSLGEDEDYYHLMLPQTTMWIGVLLNILPQFKSSDVEILFGFNLNDNFHARSCEEIKSIIENLSNTLWMGRSKLKVSFPLLTFDKKYIYEYFINEYPEYFELLWTCEMVRDGDAEECGYCCPCTVKRNILRDYINKKNDIDLKEELNRYKGIVFELNKIDRENSDIKKSIIDRTNAILNKANDLSVVRERKNMQLDSILVDEK